MNIMISWIPRPETWEYFGMFTTGGVWMRFGTRWDALGRCIHKTHADIVSQQSWKPKQYHNNCPRKIASKRSGLGITVPNQCWFRSISSGTRLSTVQQPYPCMEYLPTFVRTKSPSYVGKYTIHGSMEHMGNVQVMHSYAIFSGCPPLVRPLSMCGASLRRKVAILAVCNSKAVQNQLYMGGFQKWGIPPKWMLYNRKSYL